MSETYVEVITDYQYQCPSENGIEVKMKAGEELLLVEKTSVNWWQVIRNSGDVPFFAPSNNLKIIAVECQSRNNKYNENNNSINIMSLEPMIQLTQIHPTKDISSETSSECLCFYDHQSSVNDILIETEQEKCFVEDTDMSVSEYLDTSLEKDDSPIYVNWPFNHNKCSIDPPLPENPQIPQRELSNGWCEFLDDKTGRKYYYNKESEKSTWKPPRRHEIIEIISSDSGISKSVHNNFTVAPNPPPKQLKPKLKKLMHSSSESLESQSSYTILPPGWFEIHDSIDGISYYNEVNNQMWFPCLDDIGRSYFYNPENHKSVWDLQEISKSDYIEEPKNDLSWNETFNSSGDDISQISFSSIKSCEKEDLSLKENSDEGTVSNSVDLALDDKKDKDAIINSVSKKALKSLENKTSLQTSDSQTVGTHIVWRKAPNIPRQVKSKSLLVPECVNLVGSSSKGHLPPSFGEGYWPSVHDGKFSLIRQGTLNKTKLCENGKKIRKNWCSSFVVLTDVFLLIYKDLKSAYVILPGAKPEICIDLNGAIVDWCPDKSSRKNVFQISTVLGQQLLLQDDNAQTTKEWFETIRSAIMMLPSGLDKDESRTLTMTRNENKKSIKLSRSKSTKYYSTAKFHDADGDDQHLKMETISTDSKLRIVDKLKQFFTRRPTVESLREKGILQDELVFGCVLGTLCTRENRKVPRFVTECITIIEGKELTADGLYRASGNLSQVQRIRVRVNEDDYSCLNEEEDVHVLTGALKMFFREMREPLIPSDTLEKLVLAICMHDIYNRLETVKRVIERLPSPNYETLKILLLHLLRVIDFEKQNRMQVQNVAIVFGPSLMWPDKISFNVALDMMYQNKIMEFLLLEYKNIFC